MSVVPPLLFTLAAFTALVTIWISLKSALPAIARLRTELAEARTVHEITIHTMDPRAGAELDIDALPLPRHMRRRLRPKPITHRLHHYARTARSAA